MKNYSIRDLTKGLNETGISDGDTIFLSTQLFGLGSLKGVSTKVELLTGIYRCIYDVIGEKGTLVVPTFTQQVGRFGLPYIHEETECLTGIFGEYIRLLPDSFRSLHPIFSVSAIGPKSESIVKNISPVAFGHDSAFDRLYRLGGKAVCIGFPYYSGHITSLMHYVETSFAVPYYYNKIVTADVFYNGFQIFRPFVINVKYLNANVVFNYRHYIDALAASHAIETAAVGSGMIYSVDIQQQVDVGFDLLKENIYAFLKHPPHFNPGTPPLDGPPKGDSTVRRETNWAGFFIGVK
jgi:aminoglycoside 3-N-acetyltransferase